jgi:hypothetical protein
MQNILMRPKMRLRRAFRISLLTCRLPCHSEIATTARVVRAGRNLSPPCHSEGRGTHAVQCSRLWARLATGLAGPEIPHSVRNTHLPCGSARVRCSAPVTPEGELA